MYVSKILSKGILLLRKRSTLYMCCNHVYLVLLELAPYSQYTSLGGMISHIQVT